MATIVAKATAPGKETNWQERYPDPTRKLLKEVKLSLRLLLSVMSAVKLALC